MAQNGDKNVTERVLLHEEIQEFIEICENIKCILYVLQGVKCLTIKLIFGLRVGIDLLFAYNSFNQIILYEL